MAEADGGDGGGGDNGGRSAHEVREYLVARANDALRRPGMFGGETGIRLLLDAVAYAGAAEHAWEAEMERLKVRVAFLPTGVTGAFRSLWGVADDGSVASVYAEIAHRLGWLRLDRAVTAAEYGEIRRAGATWCREDRLLSDVLARFGPPSATFGGSSPMSPRTLAYASDRPDDALVCFHVWNGFASDPDAAATAAAAAVHPEPVLWACRAGGSWFSDGFSFTPAGAARLV